jgi:hypothetical protein
MTTLEILRGARDILRAKKRWAQGFNALDAERMPVEHYNPNAVCFCSYGAILKVCDRPPTNNEIIACEFLHAVTGTECIVAFNDAPGRKHSEVLAAFNAAIKLAVAAEKETTRNARLAKSRAMRA